jgi:hypothetical protein
VGVGLCPNFGMFQHAFGERSTQDPNVNQVLAC